jgi:hypothetical protein
MWDVVRDKMFDFLEHVHVLRQDTLNQDLHVLSQQAVVFS